MDMEKITLKDCVHTMNAVVEDYRSGKLDCSFACSQIEAQFVARKLQHLGCKVQVEYEVPQNLRYPGASGYITFNAIKTATFSKRDIRFAEKWRSKMYSKGYSWIETNQDHKIEQRAHRYKIDVLKKIFWVSNIE